VASSSWTPHCGGDLALLAEGVATAGLADQAGVFLEGARAE